MGLGLCPWPFFIAVARAFPNVESSPMAKERALTRPCASFRAPRGLFLPTFEPLVIAAKRSVVPLNCMTPINCSILTAPSSALFHASQPLIRGRRAGLTTPLKHSFGAAERRVVPLHAPGCEPSCAPDALRSTDQGTRAETHPSTPSQSAREAHPFAQPQ